MNEFIHKWTWTHLKSDAEFWETATAGLPKNFGSMSEDGSGDVPYGSSHTCVQFFRDAFSVFRPERVLEVGTNCGYGSAIMLSLGVGSVVSIDVSNRPETVKAVTVLRNRYLHRFHFLLGDLGSLVDGLAGDSFDMAYIDGCHDEECVLSDIDNCLKLGIKKFLFDDFWPHNGPGTQPAIAKRPIRVVAILGSMALAEVVDPETWNIP